MRLARSPPRHRAPAPRPTHPYPLLIRVPSARGVPPIDRAGCHTCRAMGRHTKRSGRRATALRIWTALCCLAAAAGAADLVVTRYRDAEGSPPGVDFGYF